MRTLFIFLFIHFVSTGQNLQCFSANGKYGFKSGNKVIIQPQFEYADHFYEGKAAVQSNKKWGFIDETGRFIVQPKYQKVERFAAGYAKFYENELFGLLDSTGREVIGAKCLYGSKVKDCFVYMSGKKYGWISSDNKTVIDPIYDEINVADHFVQAMKDESYDIFSVSGEMIAASTYGPSIILMDNSSSQIVDARWSTESRILDESGKQVGPVYTDLESLNCSNYYSIDEYGYEYYHNRLIKCNIVPKNDGSNAGAFHLILDNGMTYNGKDYFDLISDEKRTTVTQSGVTYELGRYGNLEVTIYKKIEELSNYKFFNLVDGTTQIAEIASFPNDTSFIATFGSVNLLYLEEPVDYNYYETDDDWMNQAAKSYYQNVVEVEGLNENRGKFALYQLDNREIITPFEPIRRELILSEDFFQYYIYKNESGLFGASLNGEHFPFKFKSYKDYAYLGFLFVDTLDHQYFYSRMSQKMLEIPFDVGIFWSEEIVEINTNEINSSEGEEGEVLYYDYSPRRFDQNFMLLQTDGESPKYGFIDGQGKYVAPQFDSISDHAGDEEFSGTNPIFSTYLNGKYGAYDFYKSTQVPPTYDAPLYFSMSDLVNMMVCPFNEEKYLLTTNNKKICSDGYEPVIEKQGKLYGVKQSSFFDDDSLVTTIPFLYKEIKGDFGYERVVLAKGQNNKWGVLSLMGGDTLLPFEYTNIEYAEEYYSTSEIGDGATWFKTYKGKKVGLFVPRFERFIPAIYDRIELDDVGAESTESHFTSVLYTHMGEKVGVYTDDLREVLPCEFDGITFQLTPYELLCFAQKGNENLAFGWTYGSFSAVVPKHQYNLVVEQTGLRKTDNGYDCFSVYTDRFVMNMKDTLSFESENLSELYQPFIKNELLGIQNKETGEILIEPKRKMLVFLDEYYLFEFKKGDTYYRNTDSPKKAYKYSEY